MAKTENIKILEMRKNEIIDYLGNIWKDSEKKRAQMNRDKWISARKQEEI